MPKRQQEYTVSPKSENQKQYVKALDQLPINIYLWASYGDYQNPQLD